MIFHDRFYVGFSDITRSLRLSNISMLRYFENIATMHGTSIGFGMKNSDVRWFLTAYHVKVLKRPEHGEKVRVDTWSRESKGFYASREFEIYDEEDNLCVIALSNWIRIDGNTMSPKRINPEFFSAYESEADHTNFGSSWVKKIKEPEDFDAEREFYIDRNFIDCNNHMNNVFYLDLANLMLPEEVYEKYSCNEFEIMYRKAIKYSETVKCLYKETDEAYIISVKSLDLSELFAVIKMYK